MEKIPTYLIVLITILVCVAIVACIYIILSFRRVRIASKKIDYLVEDLTYKLEVLSPTIDSIAKLGKIIDVFDEVFKQKSQSLIKTIGSKEEKLYTIAKEVKDVWTQAKKQISNKKVVKEDAKKI